ncbi:MAG: hypothetical protein U9N33_08155 [Campylobacterota bacterium]|nr:hypothetical protein [Campylobacterota bacterium]
MKKLSVAGRKYQKQDGSEGAEWTNLGVLNVDQKGKEYILLDPKINLAALPVGENGMIMVGVFEEQNQQNNNNQNNQQSGYNQQAGYNQPQQNNQQGYSPQQ